VQKLRKELFPCVLFFPVNLTRLQIAVTDHNAGVIKEHFQGGRSESERSNPQVSEFSALSNRLYSGRYINRTDGQPFVFAATVPDLGHERCGCTMFRVRVQPEPWRTTIKMKRSTTLDNADTAVNLWWELGLRDPDHQPNLCRACIECQSSFSVCNEQALYDRFAAADTPPGSIPTPCPAPCNGRSTGSAVDLAENTICE
jgi:hypothetical protein